MHIYFAKKTGHCYAGSVTFLSTGRMSIPRSITGFFSPEWSSLVLLWILLRPPPIAPMALKEETTLDLEWTDPDHQFPMKKMQVILLARLKTTWLVTLVRFQLAAFLSTWSKQYPVTVLKTFLMLHLHLMVSVRFALHLIYYYV